MKNYKVNLLDIPDIHIDFDKEFAASCGLDNADEILEYFLPFLEDWENNRYSTHQFAQKYTNNGISLYGEKENIFTDNTENRCSFFVEFSGECEGYLIAHCTYEVRGVLQ